MVFLSRIIGYTQGTFDLFHVGHLRLLRRARAQCDYLIVGVNDDALVESYKGKHPVIPARERQDILSELRCVDEVVVRTTLDKVDAYHQFHFQRIFIGDDWKGNPRWQQTELDMAALGVELVYLPHTDGISTRLLQDAIAKRKQ